MMASRSTAAAGGGGGGREKTYFEQQRELLIGEIAMVGNDFSSVEALWSQFESVMAKPEDQHNTETEGHEGNVEQKSTPQPKQEEEEE
ncbi:hypothetical protein QBC46DRAFT_91101 [Diplogelasinospora grovesii]|uniref:DASH complex subunit DAD1 n=1 Tax=Diplogelasinospora grovesii TaxID=303347 RepID=A0AAN6N9J1_9PEZI|nr:hypothetical protein QBC46DRAFT_91101 [Diplogelasinospora grovesii]